VKPHPLVTMLTGFIAGMKKHYAGASMMLDGKSYTETSLETLFQSCIDDSNAADEAVATKVAAVKKAHDTAALVRPVAMAFKKAVVAAYSGDATALKDFALEPPKATVKTAAVKQAAAVKAKATRQALGTKGPKQKKAAKKQLAASAAQPQPAPAPVPEAATTATDPAGKPPVKS